MNIKNKIKIKVNGKKIIFDNNTSIEKLTKKVFILLFAGCAVFILASVFIGIFEFIPRN